MQGLREWGSSVGGWLPWSSGSKRGPSLSRGLHLSLGLGHVDEEGSKDGGSVTRHNGEVQWIDSLLIVLVAGSASGQAGCLHGSWGLGTINLVLSLLKKIFHCQAFTKCYTTAKLYFN